MVHPLILDKDVSNGTLQRALLADQAIYPAAPTLDRLKQWVLACPQLSREFVFSKSTDNNHDPLPVGVLIALPLDKEIWHNVVRGAITEASISAEMIALCSATYDIGIHIFHIEKYDNWNKAGQHTRDLEPFAQYAVRVAIAIASQFNWRVIGFSALVATQAGFKAFHRIGFKPSGYCERFVDAQDDTTAVQYEYRASHDFATLNPKPLDSEAWMMIRPLGDDQASQP